MGLTLRFLLARRDPPVPSEIILNASRILEGRGHRVESLIVEDSLTRVDRLEAAADLFLVKSYTELALSLAGVLHARGARLLNSHGSGLACRDKIVAAQVLGAAGLPCPATWITSDFGLLPPLLERGPLVIKPHMGWRGIGVRVVRTPEELESLPAPRRPVLVQEFLAGPGEDLRLYAAGERVFATRKPFSSTSFSAPGRACDVSRELRDLALDCGRAFGLGLYGLDIIETSDGPKIVDVNTFPGYKGIPEAGGAVADYIEGCARGDIRLPRPGGAAQRQALSPPPVPLACSPP